jgi:hypothetical protein
MKTSSYRAQTSAGPGYGSHPLVGRGVVRQALGRVAQDIRTVEACGRIPRRRRVRGILLPSRPVEPIARLTQDRLERVRRLNHGGRRAVLPSRFRRLATNTLGVSSSLPAGGRNLSRRCALGRQTGPGLPQGIVLPAIVDARHSNSCCPLSRGSSAKPIQTDASACKPSAQSHSESLSCVRRLDDRDRDTKGFRDVGTAFQGGRNVFRG